MGELAVEIQIRTPALNPGGSQEAISQSEQARLVLHGADARVRYSEILKAQETGKQPRGASVFRRRPALARRHCEVDLKEIHLGNKTNFSSEVYPKESAYYGEGLDDPEGGRVPDGHDEEVRINCSRTGVADEVRYWGYLFVSDPLLGLL